MDFRLNKGDKLRRFDSAVESLKVLMIQTQDYVLSSLYNYSYLLFLVMYVDEGWSSVC